MDGFLGLGLEVKIVPLAVWPDNDVLAAPANARVVKELVARIETVRERWSMAVRAGDVTHPSILTANGVLAGLEGAIKRSDALCVWAFDGRPRMDGPPLVIWLDVIELALVVGQLEALASVSSTFDGDEFARHEVRSAARCVFQDLMWFSAWPRRQ